MDFKLGEIFHAHVYVKSMFCINNLLSEKTPFMYKYGADHTATVIESIFSHKISKKLFSEAELFVFSPLFCFFFYLPASLILLPSSFGLYEFPILEMSVFQAPPLTSLTLLSLRNRRTTPSRSPGSSPASSSSSSFS